MGRLAKDCGLCVAVAAVTVSAWGVRDANAERVALGDLGALIQPSGAFTGTVVWDDQLFSAFGGEISVNLGAAGAGINPGATSGTTGPVSGIPPSGSFTSTATSATAGVLFFQNAGDFVCPESIGPQCASQGVPYPASFVGDVLSLSGTFVDGGAGTLLTSLSSGAALTYTFDGDVSCDLSGPDTDCSGRIALNAFAAVDTPGGGTAGDPGDNVSVDIETTYTDPTTGNEVPVEVEIIYDFVQTAGTTTVTTSSQAGGNIADNLAVGLNMWQAIFFDVRTDATTTGSITVCTSYPDEPAPGDGYLDGAPGVRECNLRMLHKEGDTFEDSTLDWFSGSCPLVTGDPMQPRCPTLDEPLGFTPCIDIQSNVICGTGEATAEAALPSGPVTTLPPFVVAIDLAPQAIPTLGPWLRVLLGSGLLAGGLAALRARGRFRR